jgi:hypothetical protein
VDQRHLIGAPGRDMAVERVVAGVDHGAGKPAAVEPARASKTFFGFSIQSISRRRLAPKALGIALC